MLSPDELIESRLKYNRMQNDAKTITQNDSISCMVVHDKFTVVGTEWGNIHFLDSQGNSCFKTMSLHSRRINQLSIDKDGEYIASCSDDQKVMVYGLFDTKSPSIISFHESIKAVAISPDFKRTNQFITGDHRLMLVSKGFLNTDRHKTIWECKTKLQNIKWRKDVAVCACTDCAYIIDMKEMKVFGIIEIKASRADMRKYKCQTYWISDTRFLLGWCHEVHLYEIIDERIHLQVQSSSTNPSLSAAMPNSARRKHPPSSQQIQQEISNLTKILPGASPNQPKKVESIYTFNHLDMVIGLVNYGDYVLALLDPISEKEHNERDDLYVVILEYTEKLPESYVEISGDKIQLRGFDKTKMHSIDVIFEKLPDEEEFIIASSKDVLSVRERDIDDRIKWLVEKKNFKRALMLLQQPEAKSSVYSYKETGFAFMKFLLDQGKSKEAADLCITLVDDVSSWEHVINDFLSYQAVEEILDHIPISDSMRLSRDTYQKVLNVCYLKVGIFLQLLKMWPPTLYYVDKTINLLIKDQANEYLFISNNTNKPVLSNRDKLVMRSMAILYEHDQQYTKAFEVYVRLKDPYLFELIPKRNMFDIVVDKLNFLLSHDRAKTLELLMEYMAQIPPETVVKILKPIPQHLFYYLSELKSRNQPASEPYHLKLVHLYSVFEKDKLLAFLNSSDKYDLNEAYNMCKERKLDEEQIYLLGRMGQSREALNMIMSQKKVGAPLKAIQYCQSHQDPELWQQLMSYGVDKPEYVTAILENTTVEEIDTKKFINNVLAKRADENAMPGLKNSLVRLLIHNEERMALLQSNQTVRWRDLDAILRHGCVNSNSCALLPIIFDDSLLCTPSSQSTHSQLTEKPPISLVQQSNSSIILANQNTHNTGLRQNGQNGDANSSQSGKGICLICSKSLQMCSREFVVLRCRHFYHTQCLREYVEKHKLHIVIEEFNNCLVCSRS